MRILSKYVPLALFGVPGLILWLLGTGIAILLFIRGPIAGFTTHTSITGAIFALIGFQLIVLSFAMSLYATETHNRKSNQVSAPIAANIPQLASGVLGFILLFAGIGWFSILVRTWWLEESGQFLMTESLVMALSLIVGSLQLISLMFILRAISLRRG